MNVFNYFYKKDVALLISNFIIFTEFKYRVLTTNNKNLSSSLRVLSFQKIAPLKKTVLHSIKTYSEEEYTMQYDMNILKIKF